MGATVVKDGVDLTVQTAALASTLATAPVSSLPREPLERAGERLGRQVGAQLRIVRAPQGQLR